MGLYLESAYTNAGHLLLSYFSVGISALLVLSLPSQPDQLPTLSAGRCSGNDLEHSGTQETFPGDGECSPDATCVLFPCHAECHHVSGHAGSAAPTRGAGSCSACPRLLFLHGLGPSHWERGSQYRRFTHSTQQCEGLWLKQPF